MLRDKRLLTLIALAVLVWLNVAFFTIFQKTSLLDDAFIYMHVANNVLETGTARFFPITDNPGLVTSSPLKLMVLIPAAAVARVLTDPARSIEAVRVTLVLYGIFACLIFLPFYRGHIKHWLLGLVFAGLVARSTETGLQMEGLLLFWTLFTWFFVFIELSEDKRFFQRLGYILALMMITRPEYGFAAMVLMLVYVARRRSRSALIAFGQPFLVVGIGWLIIASVLRVYPIPTTYLSKVVTAELDWFSGGTFWNMLSMRGQYMFFANVFSHTAVVIAGVIVMAGVITAASRCYIWFVAFAGLSLLAVLRSAGAFLWYTENYFIVMLTICFAIAIDIWKKERTRRRMIELVVVLVPLVLFFANGITRNRPMSWNFRDKMTRAHCYTYTARKVADQGRFDFGEMGTFYVAMTEIGIVSYFAGAGVWLLDQSGLAQPGSLPGIVDHALAIFYPRSVLISDKEELEELYKKFGIEEGKYPIYLVQGSPDLKHVEGLCDHYIVDVGVCLRRLR